jgi:hypothetical protein
MIASFQSVMMFDGVVDAVERIASCRGALGLWLEHEPGQFEDVTQ